MLVKTFFVLLVHLCCHDNMLAAVMTTRFFFRGRPSNEYFTAMHYWGALLWLCPLFAQTHIVTLAWMSLYWRYGAWSMCSAEFRKRSRSFKMVRANWSVEFAELYNATQRSPLMQHSLSGHLKLVYCLACVHRGNETIKVDGSQLSRQSSGVH